LGVFSRTRAAVMEQPLKMELLKLTPEDKDILEDVRIDN
jgi:hypothetical protein